MASANQHENKFTPFDDVDLFEAEYHDTSDNCCDVNNAIAEQSDKCHIPTDDAVESATYSFADINSNKDFVNQLETDRLEENTNADEEDRCTLSAEVDKCCDSVDGNGDHSVIIATHSSSLSPEVVNLDVQTFPSTYTASSDLETSTAVLTLDSDVDSPQRRKTYCDLDSGDGMEVDVAALQLQLTQLSMDRDNLKLLYSQSMEENENYQEQILEVWPGYAMHD